MVVYKLYCTPPETTVSGDACFPSCRDRVNLFFLDLSSHLSRVITSAAQNQFLLERAVVSVLHLALRLLGRGDFPIIQVGGILWCILYSSLTARPFSTDHTPVFVFLTTLLNRPDVTFQAPQRATRRTFDSTIALATILKIFC